MKLRKASRTFIALACLGLSVPGGAEDTAAVGPGDRDRVTEGDERDDVTLTGTVRLLQPGILTLDLQPEPIGSSEAVQPLPPGAIVRAEVRTPPDGLSRALTGSALGIVIGVGVAAVAASLNHGSAFCDTNRATGCELGIGAVLGGVSGFAIGALTTGDDPPRARRSPDPDETQTAVGPPSPAVSRR